MKNVFIDMKKDFNFNNICNNSLDSNFVIARNINRIIIGSVKEVEYFIGENDNKQYIKVHYMMDLSYRKTKMKSYHVFRLEDIERIIIN